MYKRIFAVFLLLSSISLVLPLPPHISLFFGILQTFFLPGFVLLLFLNDEKRDWFGGLVIAALLSPVIFTFSTLLILRFTGDIGTSLRVFLFITYFFLGVSIITGKLGRSGSGAPRSPGIPVVSLVFGGLVAALFIINPSLMKRSDSWYHASIISEILTRGVPPMEPYLADLPIKYMWFYHFFMASVIELSGLRIFPAMALFNVMAAFSLPYLIARYASYFTRRARDITIAVILAIAGLESVSWILWPIHLGRSLFGEVRGVDEVMRTIGKIELDSSNVIFSLNPFGTWMVNLPDKFITITVFGYSLDLFLLGLLAALGIRSREKIRANDFVLLLSAIAGSLIFHVVTGVTLLCSVTGSVILIFLVHRLIVRKRIPSVRLLLILLTGIAAFSLSLPMLKRVDMSSGRENIDIFSNYLHLGWRNLFTILAPLLILFCPARDSFKKIFARHGKPYHEVIAGWAVCLLVLNLFVDLPSVNESKFIFPLFLLIGPPIFVEISKKISESSGARRRGLILLTIFLFAPAPILTFRGFLMNRPSSRIEAVRNSAEDGGYPVFAWIRENTAPDAVIIENNRYHLMPVLAHRRNLYSDLGIIGVLGYGEDVMSRYENAEKELFSDLPLSAKSIETLTNIEYDLYIAVWEEDLEAVPYLSDRFGLYPDLFEPVYKNGRIELYRFKKPDPGKRSS